MGFGAIVLIVAKLILGKDKKSIIEEKVSLIASGF